MTIHKIFGEIVESERLRKSATSCHHHYHLPTLTHTHKHTQRHERETALDNANNWILYFTIKRFSSARNCLCVLVYCSAQSSMCVCVVHSPPSLFSRFIWNIRSYRDIDIGIRQLEWYKCLTVSNFNGYARIVVRRSDIVCVCCYTVAQ